MLTKDDLKALDNILGKKIEPINRVLDQHSKKFDRVEVKLDKVEEKLDTNTASVLRVEQKIKSALGLRVDVKDLRKQSKKHEERISSLEIV